MNRLIVIMTMTIIQVIHIVNDIEIEIVSKEIIEIIIMDINN